MAMAIAHNVNAIGIQRTLNASNSSLSGSLQKLSTGYKINAGKDDPSGLVISELLRSQTNGIARAVQNTQEANNVLGIAEGALNEMNNILTKMRQLAIHAANDGITSNDQIAADQAEVDSSVQTLDRIARTTTYSGDNLLNGNKGINYDTTVLVKNTRDMSMVDKGLTDVRQIFKREDFQLNINFSGYTDDATKGRIDNGNGATKAYFEITTKKTGAEATQVTGGTNDDSILTHDQAFTLTGNLGSRTVTFAKGTHLGEMVTSINGVTDSTGVKASLIFDSNTEALSASVQATGGYARDADGNVYAANVTAGATLTMGVTAVTNIGTTASVGINVDGDGRIYAKMIDNKTIMYYKDKAMTMAVGKGSTTGSTFTELNDSKLGTASLAAFAKFSAGCTAVLQFLNVASSGATTDGAAIESSANFTSSLSGVRLGVNTSETGQLYFNFVSTDGTTGQVFIYRDAKMNDTDLVAKSVKEINVSTGAVNIYAEMIGDTGYDTGLYGKIELKAGIDSGTIKFQNLGVRLNAAEYGTDQYVKINQTQGAIWSRYDSEGNAHLIDAGLSGAEWTNYGNNAKLALNGQRVELQGIAGTLSNLDTTADIIFKEGEVGNTTIATVGYNDGSFATRAGKFAENFNIELNALHSTTEIIGEFTGGMQFQLGEGAGSQNRTVYSVKDITATALGKMKFSDYFGNNFKTEKYLSINDMMSGGMGSLAVDAVKSMSIVTKAISDVSEMRANIGAFQSNMLQTNANSLQVAFEKITETESYIRDTDMATESTAFTKNQVLVQAGTSMLAQANQLPQTALSLIG
jgi:flagellin